MPATPPSTTDDWWCDMNTEYAFVGFSYEVTACQDLNQLQNEFTDIRQRFNGRYVRMYGACDRDGFYDNVITAAWGADLGVHALIWFGFDGDNIWETRRDTLFATLHANPKAKFVTRTVQFGSEPLYDNVLSEEDLAAQVLAAKNNLSSLGIPVTERGGAKDVLNAIDLIDAHMLPFFSQQASTGLMLNKFVNNGEGKKIYLSENGWPSVTSEGVQPNSPNAVADIQNESDYYKLLDSMCSYFKAVQGGGVGWFAHIYSDAQEPGYGIYDDNGNLKFDFSPATSC
ncbi:glycoside hydrolase superfamily [Desarmillaria tabescens]|uniref:glucan endo-1,3-beta-D-glucosidase n=1 Tax=Armillaria tabescens TaxID=1929756 RepID=A0AA39KC22_ARMTA|nr:glycoside hydrolase superfamily [Desarmillaria tabescens]KAK0458407.1 glycoside hydrolase superfamily [Desarmillaria tabescens]